MDRRRFCMGALALGVGTASGFPVLAQSARELTLAVGASVTSMDPHFHNLTPNSMVARHCFDTLIEQDEKQHLSPSLAESWRALDDTTWEFKLRRGVKFHDGADFTAEDVVASYQRVPWVPNSPSAYTIYLAAIKETRIVDPFTVHFVTHSPSPLLPAELSSVYIVSKQNAQAPTVDFNNGKAMNGTGPYKFVEFAPGDRIAFVANAASWRPVEPWSKVTMKIITNSASRVAALRAGDVQFIDQVPVNDIAGLKQNPQITVVGALSNRLIYLHMDHQRDVTPFITDKAGAPLAKNPLKDLRVRKAISKAIDRARIVERVLEGEGVPASQLLPDGFAGVSANLKVERFDIDGAKKLLADAGYPQGFRMTLHGPNDRYIADEKVLQAVAQMMFRIGIEAKVETMPWSGFAGRSSRQEFSIFLVGWGAGTGETSSSLRSLLATFDRDKGMGGSNRGRYSNPEVDRLIAEGLATIDDAKRNAILARASEVAVNDLGVIPLHYEISSWALRKGFSYVGRSDQGTLAMGVRQS